MINSNNKVSLYKKLDEELIGKVGLKIEQPTFQYKINDLLKEIETGEEFEGVLTINEYDTEWSPNENDLIVKQRFVFEKPSLLFGKEGIALEGSIIGIAVHIHSKTSNFQKKMNFGSIIPSEKPIVVNFEHKFPKDTLRGNLSISFFLYLQKVGSLMPFQADKVGMLLSENDLYNIELIIDGIGSAFPINEFSDKNKPLWILEKNWADASDDTFDSSNVNLSLNIAHPLFEQVKAGKTKVSRAMMGDIMIQAMAMIIQQVILVEEKSLTEVDESSTSSILAVVNYWITTFEVDTTSLFSIMNSLRTNLEKDMLGEE